MVIRDAMREDIPQIRDIYAHSVLHDTASFELVPPTSDDMETRWRGVIDGGYPYLVAACPDGRTTGYCYASAYRPRPAYRTTVESSVYVGTEFRRQGVARRLLTALISACATRGFEQMIAVISDPNRSGSVALHASLGFRSVGTLASVGQKFDRRIDVALMQLEL